MRYSLILAFVVLSACSKVDAPPLYTVPEIPEDKAVQASNDDSVTQDEISEIIKKREELLKTGE